MTLLIKSSNIIWWGGKDWLGGMEKWAPGSGKGLIPRYFMGMLPKRDPHNVVLHENDNIKIIFAWEKRRQSAD